MQEAVVDSEVAAHEGARPLRASAWSVTARIAFRFCFVYFCLYCLFNQVLGGLVPVPSINIPDLATLPPTSWLVAWVSIHIFHVTHPLVLESGSGDKTIDWVLDVCLIVAALLATATWSILDRRRAQYEALAKWFRVFLRFALAGQMFGYGAVKFIPLQMPSPSLARLVEPFGNFSPMGALWYSVGASPGYERFAGAAEILAGLLLILPRTALLGALVCMADMVQIFMLNMTYDIPVKLFSFQLALMALYLAAPELSRLKQFFLADRAVEASTQSLLFRSRRANRYAVAAQLIFGLLLAGANLLQARHSWYEYGGGSPRSPLYGIWNVEQMSTDGHPHPLLSTESGGFRRVIFDRPDMMAFQQMDDTFLRYDAKVNAKDGTVVLSKEDDKSWHGNLRYEQPSTRKMTLAGVLGGQPVQMQLQLVDRNQFLLVNRGFHWVQEYPFNR
jgi:hypothetical protein